MIASALKNVADSAPQADVDAIVPEIVVGKVKTGIRKRVNAEISSQNAGSVTIRSWGGETTGFFPRDFFFFR